MTASVTEEIILRQTEILNRKHDIAIWQASTKESSSCKPRTDETLTTRSARSMLLES